MTSVPRWRGVVVLVLPFRRLSGSRLGYFSGFADTLGLLFGVVRLLLSYFWVTFFREDVENEGLSMIFDGFPIGYPIGLYGTKTCF